MEGSMELYKKIAQLNYDLVNPKATFLEISEEIEEEQKTMTEYADLFLCLVYIF